MNLGHFFRCLDCDGPGEQVELDDGSIGIVLRHAAECPQEVTADA